MAVAAAFVSGWVVPRSGCGDMDMGIMACGAATSMDPETQMCSAQLGRGVVIEDDEVRCAEAMMPVAPPSPPPMPQRQYLDIQTDTPPFRFAKYAGPFVEYPIDDESATVLSGTNAWSPIVTGSPFVKQGPLSNVPAAQHPDDAACRDVNAHVANGCIFWSEFEEVVDFQLQRKMGMSAQIAASTDLTVPKIMKGFTFDGERVLNII